jgi:hypothetical protein
MEPESYIRNIVLGRRLLRKFAPGVNLEVMTHNDVMPDPSQMLQILTMGGYRYFLANRPREALTAEGIPRDFVWVGPDGSELLTSRGFVCGFIKPESLPGDFATNFAKAVETVFQKEIGFRLEPPEETPRGCRSAATTAARCGPGSTWVRSPSFPWRSSFDPGTSARKFP